MMYMQEERTVVVQREICRGDVYDCNDDDVQQSGPESVCHSEVVCDGDVTTEFRDTRQSTDTRRPADDC